MTSNDGFSVVAPIRRHQSLFHAVQKRILLGLVEAVDFVDEEDGPPAAGPGDVRPGREPRGRP